MWSLWRRKKGEEDKAGNALASATENLRETQKRSHEVAKVTNALKGLNERNGFAEALEAMIMAHKGTPQ